MYSKICVKQPLKNRQNKGLKGKVLTSWLLCLLCFVTCPNISWSTSKSRARSGPWNWFKLSSKIFLLTVPRRYFFCGSFVLFMSCVCHAFASVHCCLVVTWRERADLLALVCDVYCDFATFSFCILGQVWCLIVLIPNPCCLFYLMTIGSLMKVESIAESIFGLFESDCFTQILLNYFIAFDALPLSCWIHLYGTHSLLFSSQLSCMTSIYEFDPCHFDFNRYFRWFLPLSINCFDISIKLCDIDSCTVKPV